MRTNEKQIMKKLQYLNERIKLLEKEKQKLEAEYEKLTYDLVYEINNENVKVKKV